MDYGRQLYLGEVKMKVSTPQLRALLFSGQFAMAELYTFTVIDGTAYRYTSWDQDLTVGGFTYAADDVLINRDQISWKTGLQVGQLQLTAYPGDASELEGLPFLSAVRYGLLDGATFTCYRLFMPTAGDTSVAPVFIFQGRVGEAVAGRTSVEITVYDFIEVLNIDMPRHQWQPSCVWTVYDTGCSLNRNSFKVTTSVTGSPTQSQIGFSSGQANGYFQDGTCKFTTGDNAGLTRTIGTNTSGNLMLVSPFPFVPTPGDMMELLPGCNRTQTRCVSPFNNLVNYRGYDYVPVVETAL